MQPNKRPANKRMNAQAKMHPQAVCPPEEQARVLLDHLEAANARAFNAAHDRLIDEHKRIRDGYRSDFATMSPADFYAKHRSAL